MKTVAKRALKLPPAQRGAALSRHRVVLGLLECLRVQPPRGPPSGRALPGSTMSLRSGPPPSLTAQELSGAIWSLGVLGRDASHEAEMEALCALLPSVRFDSLQQVGMRGEGCAGCSCAGRCSARRDSLPCKDTCLAGTRGLHGMPRASCSRWANGPMDPPARTNFNRVNPVCRCFAGALLQVADVCWALGVARHWSPHLPLLEQQAAELVETALAEAAAGAVPQGASSRGGRARVSHSQLSNTVWGLVALGHAPARLLGTLPGVLQQWHSVEEGGAGQEGPGGAPHSAFPSLCTLAWCAAASGQLGPGEVCRSLLGALARSAEALTSGGAAPPAGSAGGTGKAAAHVAHAGGPTAKQAMQLHQVALALALPLVEEQPTSSSAVPCSPQTLGSNVGRALEGMTLPPEAAGTLQRLFTQAGLGVQRLAGDNRMQQVGAAVSRRGGRGRCGRPTSAGCPVLLYAGSDPALSTHRPAGVCVPS